MERGDNKDKKTSSEWPINKTGSGQGLAAG